MTVERFQRSIHLFEEEKKTIAYVDYANIYNIVNRKEIVVLECSKTGTLSYCVSTAET